MARLKTTTVNGKLSVVGTIDTEYLSLGSTTVTGISDTVTNDSTKLATAKAVYDYVQSVLNSGAANKYGNWKIDTNSSGIFFTYTG